MGIVSVSGPAGTPKSLHQLKISLRNVRPPIWRRLQVSSATSLSGLHFVLQAAMGWDDSHLHQFTIGGEIYADDRVEDPWGGRPKDEARFRLDKVAPLGTRFRYDYDFGDGWEHDVVVEKILPPEPAVTYPRCLTGRRACPPEDCGGPWGYASLLAAIADPDGSGDRKRLEWAGEHFDPEAFDPVTVNALFVPRSRRRS